jgi:hypothetical protein
VAADTEYIVRSLKHYVKAAIGKPDPVWLFYRFEHSINAQTKSGRKAVLDWAEEKVAEKGRLESREAYAASKDPVVIQGFELKQKAEKSFKGKRAGETSLRILVHVPDQKVSPGHYSLFSNFIESFEFIGISARAIGPNESAEKVFSEFKPTIFLSIDHPNYLRDIDWPAVDAFKKQHGLHIGLVAYLEGEDGDTPLLPRLAWGKEHGVGFYYSFKDPDFLRTDAAYKPFHDQGSAILTIPFGANPLHYYPVPNIEKDIDYIFLGSISWKKGLHADFARKIVSRAPGFIDGFGWKHAPDFRFNRDRDRYIYARGKTGFNFHIPDQISHPSEVNERTHQLAACGIPQITDRPMLLSKLYSADAMFVADDEHGFRSHFKRIIDDPEYGRKKALIAQREAFEKHTTFHRADDFAKQLLDFLEK